MKKAHKIFDEKHRFKKRKLRLLSKKEIARLLVFIFILNNFILFAYFYPKISGKIMLQQVNVTRVIDGDTFESGIGKVRLLGVNSPERGMSFYEEAKEFLAGYEGKEVMIEVKEKDKYGRILAYVWDDEFVNEEILEQGLAHLYVYDEDEYYSELEKAEADAREHGLGVWKKSSNYGCVELVELKYEENERCKNQEQLILNNKCAPLNIVVKDDATHIYNLELESGNFVMNFSCIWNDDGDSVYIWDEDGLLMWYRY